MGPSRAWGAPRPAHGCSAHIQPHIGGSVAAPVVHLPVGGEAGLHLAQVGQRIVGGQPLTALLLPEAEGAKGRDSQLGAPPPAPGAQGLFGQPPASRGPARVAAPLRAPEPPRDVRGGQRRLAGSTISCQHAATTAVGCPEVRRLMATPQGLTRQQVSWLPGRQRPAPLSRASWRLEGALVGHRRPGRLKTATDNQ